MELKNLKSFESFVNEAKDDDMDKWLSPKQRKLPEGLKKAIAAKNKKAGKVGGKAKEECESCKDDKKKD